MSEKLVMDKIDKYIKSEGFKPIGKNDVRNHARSIDDGRPDRAYPLKHGITVYVEYKTKERYLSKNHGLSERQKTWKDYLLGLGHPYLVHYDYHVVKEFVERYMK